MSEANTSLQDEDTVSVCLTEDERYFINELMDLFSPNYNIPTIRDLMKVDLRHIPGGLFKLSESIFNKTVRK